MKKIFNIYSISKLILYSLLFACPYLSSAACFGNGKKVPAGTRIGIMLCMDGKWLEEGKIPPISPSLYMELERRVEKLEEELANCRRSGIIKKPGKTIKPGYLNKKNNQKIIMKKFCKSSKGYRVPEGTELDGKVCTNGRWKHQP